MSKKIIILVIDSDACEIYKFAKDIWQINSKLSNTKVIFLNTSTNITDDSSFIMDDHFYSKYHNSMSFRIIDKTLKGFNYCLANEEFDYILRTNLSSFFNLKKLLDYINICPSTNFYGGSIEYYPYNLSTGNLMLSFCSGSGFILSKDLVYNLASVNNEIPVDIPDDVWFGARLINYTRTSFNRFDFCDYSQLDSDSYANISSKILHSLSENTFHYRIKNDNSNRLLIDSFILSCLLNYFK